MKTNLLFLTFLLLAFCALSAQETIPAEAEQFYQRAMKEINPKHINWIKRTAANVNTQKLDESAIMDNALNYGTLLNMDGNDIMTLVLIVMMEASKSAQEDLKSIMNEVKSQNEEKRKIRDAQRYMEEARDRLTYQVLDSFKLIAKSRVKAVSVVKPATVQTVKPIARVNTVPTQKVSEADINSTKEQLKDKLDSMNEMGEVTSLRLQMAMDRRSKFISTLSNIMKKIGSTQDTIIQNLK